jgi:hypothetical protein
MNTDGGSTNLSEMRHKAEGSSSLTAPSITPIKGITALCNGVIVSLLDLPEPKQQVPASLPREAALVNLNPGSVFLNSFIVSVFSLGPSDAAQ